MWNKIKNAIGTGTRSPYVNQYFEEANIRSSVYMSAVVIVLELWMIIRTFVKYVLLSDTSRDLNWIVSHFYSYFILLAIAVIVFVYAVGYLRNHYSGRKTGRVLIIIFAALCIAFGIFISASDYARGRQILTFLTMELYVWALLIWRPVISFLVLSSTFILFYYQVNQTTLAAGSVFYEGDRINYFIFWISIMMVSISQYHQRYDEAMKDEDLEEANARLNMMAVRDDVTGIHNMNYFVERSSQLLLEESVNPKDWLFLFLDIENYKYYNDHYGFEKGNILLTNLAETVEKVFDEAVTARQSDDHFVVFTPREGCFEKIDLVRDYISENQGDIKLGLKAGSFGTDKRDVSVRLACDRARYACSIIKKKYDINYREYDEKLDKEFHKRQYIVDHIEEAVEKGYIQAYYQPVVQSDGKELCGCEALARWIDPEYGFLSPGEFIPILEEYRLIHRLDECIYERVFSDMRNAIDRDGIIFPVSINFSRLDFELMDVVAVLERLTDKYRVPKDFIHVEITESALTDNMGNLNSAIEKLRELGYALWLDDFGSGYSSFNVLKDYHFEVLKIDMKFLDNLEGNENSKIIIKSIIEMAEALNMNTLAEGVENEEQSEFLTQIHCERQQGYLYGRPMTIGELEKRLRSGQYTISPQLASVNYR